MTQKKSLTSRKSKQKVIKYKNVRKIVRTTPTRGEIGQLFIRLLAVKGKRRIIVTGYSYLNDASKKETYRRMESQAIKSAWSKIPFSPQSTRITSRRYIYFRRK